jgi:spermidine synthase
LTESELWYTEEYTEHIRFSYRVTDLLLRKETKYQLLEILETPEFGRLMLLDGKVMVTERDEHIYHEMLVHPAMLLHPDPRKVLVVGGGDGGTIRELVRYPGLQKAVLAEIDNEVIEASEKYFPVLTSGLSDPRVKLQIGDAAEYVRTTKDRFDICYIDCTDVAGPGPTEIAGTLITDEFLDNLSDILTDDGIMVAQSETPVYSAAYLKNYSRRLRERYPHVATYAIMVPSYAGLWSLTWAAKTIEPFSEITKTPPQGLRYFSPTLFAACLEMGKIDLWGDRPQTKKE